MPLHRSGEPLSFRDSYDLHHLNPLKDIDSDRVSFAEILHGASQGELTDDAVFRHFQCDGLISVLLQGFDLGDFHFRYLYERDRDELVTLDDPGHLQLSSYDSGHLQRKLVLQKTVSQITWVNLLSETFAVVCMGREVVPLDGRQHRPSAD